MKVAILLSGQPRNYSAGYLQLKKKYLDRYDCDVFIHSWDEPEYHATNHRPWTPGRVYKNNDNWKEEVLDLYKPVTYKFERQIIFDETGRIDPTWNISLQNTLSMWYSLKSVFGLCKPGYDKYIRTRFDLRYENSCHELETLSNKLHIWNWDTDLRVRHQGFNDLFAVGSYYQLGVYCSLFNRLRWYLENDGEFQQSLIPGDSVLRGEYILKWHLHRTGIQVQTHENSIPSHEGQIIR